MTRADAEEILFREARLLDTLQLDTWLTLFTEDGLYRIPIDENASVSGQAALVNDDRLRREERVFHLLNNRFPAQQPRSRTVHVISNVLVESRQDEVLVLSNQVIYEMRAGDAAQIGLGDLRPLVASVEHTLRPVDGHFKIASKTILLIDRDSWQTNLTFII